MIRAGLGTRRATLATALLCAAVVGHVGVAQATFHLEKVNEVMLASSTGDRSVQFVELLDTGGTEEQFTPVFAPYQLVVYDGAGNQLGTQTLDPTGLRTAAGPGTEYLIGTAAADAAFGVKSDEPLTITLPPAVAQVCFRGNPGVVSCIDYGSITTPVPQQSSGTGAVHGPVPPNGESDQRQPDDSVVAAPPTPKAKNRGPAAPGPGTAPYPAPGPGGSPGSGGGFAGVGFASRSSRVDRHGRALVLLSCPVATVGGCHGRLVLSLGRRVVGSGSFALTAGQTKGVRVRLSAGERRVLKRHRRVSVHADATATDDAGHTARAASALTLVG